VTEVAIEEVTTEDATPTAAPFRISDKAEKDLVTFKVKVTASSIIRAIRVRFKPLNRNSGQRLYSRGMVCGSGDVCGSPDARSLLVESPHTTGTVSVTDAQVGAEPDGEYDVSAFALADEGWS
jgi:hypothetical protein